MKIAVAALRDAEVPFVLGGSVAAWARGGPEPDNDLDLMVPPAHADAALDEHALDYTKLLAITRALREQIDRPSLRARASGSPFAKAYITLVEELGIAPTDARGRPDVVRRVRVVGDGA